MGREYDALFYGRECVREGDTGRHLLPDQFDTSQNSVTVVEVIDVHVDSQRLQGTYAADAEDHLLCNAFFLEPAIELSRQVPAGVARQRSVEEVKRRIAKGGAFPHLYAHLFVTDGYADDHARILERVVPVLVVTVVRAIVLVDELLGIVLTPQDTDPDHRPFGVRGRFQDVARQDAQTPGVDMQLFMQPELHAEVGYPGHSFVHCKPPLCSNFDDENFTRPEHDFVGRRHRSPARALCIIHDFDFFSYRHPGGVLQCKRE